MSASSRSFVPWRSKRCTLPVVDLRVVLSEAKLRVNWHHDAVWHTLSFVCQCQRWSSQQVSSQAIDIFHWISQTENPVYRKLRILRYVLTIHVDFQEPILGCKYFSDVISGVLVCKYVEIIFMNCTTWISRFMKEQCWICSYYCVSLWLKKALPNLRPIHCSHLYVRTCFCSIVLPHHHVLLFWLCSAF